MKKLFLLIVVLAIGAAAYFTKPNDPKQSFSDYLDGKYLDGKAQQGAESGFPIEWTAPMAREFADHCEYPNHFFWVDAKIGDKTIYTNVYGHWINRADAKKDFQNFVEKAKEKMDHAADKIAGK